MKKKLTVDSYIGDYNERGRKAFKKRISSILKTQDITGHVICIDAYMKRASGYGSYYKCIEIQIVSDDIYMKEHTNDSTMWDNFEGSTKEKNDLFEAVLYSKVENLKDEIQEATEERAFHED